MTNALLLRYTIGLARECNHMALLCRRLGEYWRADQERTLRDTYMKDARALRRNRMH